MQGMISHGDIELSVISKNFFFTFFNLFGVFTVFGTFSNFYGFFDNFREVFRELSTAELAYGLASSLERLAPFYVNLIVLQGLGLFPFRLLEFGAVAMYPIGLVGAKTPRGKNNAVHKQSYFVYKLISSQIMQSWSSHLYSTMVSTSRRQS